MLEQKLRGEFQIYGLGLTTLGNDFEPHTIVTTGHCSPVRFIAACNALARVEWGWKNLAEGDICDPRADYSETLLNVMTGMRYCHARYVTADEVDDDDDAYDWTEFDWYLVPEPEGTPDAVPITVWSEYPRLWECM